AVGKPWDQLPELKRGRREPVQQKHDGSIGRACLPVEDGHAIRFDPVDGRARDVEAGFGHGFVGHSTLLRHHLPPGHHLPRCAPPSTWSTSPVTVGASVRNNTAAAISCTVETRPIGDSFVRAASGVFLCSGVATTPGATALTRMPSRAYSIARWRVTA